MRGSLKLAGAIIGVACLIGATTARAANLASGNAADPAYNGGWTNGSNGGNGFGPWAFQNAVGGSIALGNSSSNGAGDNTGDINTPHSTSGRAWGLSSNVGALVDAVRPFTGGALSVGQTFNIDLDSGFVGKTGTIGFDLANAADDTTIFSLGFQHGLATYFVDDSVSPRRDTGVAFTDAGIHVGFTLTSDTMYSATITPLGGSSTVITGTLAVSTGDHALQNLDLVSAGTGTQASNVTFFNNISIVPEPTSLCLLGLGSLGLLGRRRKYCWPL